MKRPTVGRSDRTPAKHALMCSFYGCEVGAANNIPSIKRLLWMDLTAGDGTAPATLPWKLNCSPGINAYYAIGCQKPVDVVLYEIKPATYGRLLVSLTEELPALGYRQVGDAQWVFGDHVTLKAIHGSGAQAPVSHIRQTDAVLVSNDPNAITEWAMRPTFAVEVTARPWCSRFISTMGCNTAGLKRLDKSIRDGWFDRVNEQAAALPPHRDLLLAAIKGDDAQWAYLLCEPIKWRKSKVEPMVRTAFNKHGYTIDMAWLGLDPVGFDRLTRKLFQTRQELGVFT